MNATGIDPVKLLRPHRKIVGISAILLPFDDAGAIDWPGFESHLKRTQAAGLTPAVNMDTGYIHLLSMEERQRVLARTRSTLAGEPFVAGAFVDDRPGEPIQIDAYARAADLIQEHGGTPVIFPSFGLTEQSPDAILKSYQAIAKSASRFIAFELSPVFAPFGRVFDLPTFQAIMEIPACIGLKHSSLSRELEWERLILRDRVRPEFHLFTGNDLAIDMVMYGSDYLLGLSTCAPDLFARRDEAWRIGDPSFYELNDRLQYLGFFTFRDPVPAYKHSAAQFLKVRGWIGSDRTHPKSPKRPDSDVAILKTLAEQLGVASTNP